MYNYDPNSSCNKLWIRETNPSNAAEWAADWYAFNGLYAYTERPGGISNSVAYDERLNLKSAVNGDNVQRVFTHEANHFNLPSLSGVPLAGGQTLNLAADPFCSSNAYAFTPQGLKTTVFSYPEDGSAVPFEEGYVQTALGGLSGTFSEEGREGSFTNDAPPSTGTYTKTVTLPNGGVRTYRYRKFLLRETTARDAGSLRKVTKTYGYDGLGEPTSYTTDEKGFKETFTVGRDAKGLVGGIHSTARGAATFVRNASGQIDQIIAPSGVTTLGWLANGALGSVQDDAGPIFSRTLDPLGRDSAVTRLNGTLSSTVGLAYGNDGGFAAKTRDGVQTLSCTSRRADGRPRSLTLPDGVVVTKDYDAAGRPTGELWADPADPSRNVAFACSWMRDGRLRTQGQTGGPQVSNIVFRAGGRVQSQKAFFNCPDGRKASVLTSFDAATGSPSGTEPQFDGVTNDALGTAAEYDALGHIGLISGSGFYVTFACADGGAVTNTSVTVGGNELLTRSVTWSASAGKPARVGYALGGQLLRRWQYAFTNGLVASAARSGGDGHRTEYGYDGRRRLVSASSCATNGAALPGLSFAYAYSGADDAVSFGPAGNENWASASGDLHTMRMWMPYAPLLGRVAAPGASVTVSFGTETNDAAVAGGLYYSTLGISGLVYPPYACTSGIATVTATLPGGTSDTARVSVSVPALYEYPSYTARGMALSDSRRRFRWDAAGRLLAVTNSGVSPATLLKFEYYPDGRRASKSVLRLTNGAWAVARTLHYAWQGWKLAAECERDGSGNVTAVRSFVWGPDIWGQQSGSLESGAEGIGGLLLIRVWTPAGGSRLYLPLTDGLGSVCGLIDASDGSLAAEYDYDPYGGVVIERGPAAGACPFRHRTRYYDRETWLYYYGHRYYDPSTTKWISKDPKGEAGGWNLTAFCGNDPINNYDALGLEPQNVLEVFMPGIAESDAYQLTSSWDDPEPFRALSLSEIDAVGMAPELSANAFSMMLFGVGALKENMDYYGSPWLALNATYNPMVEGIEAAYEVGDGIGYRPFNSGQRLSTDDRWFSAGRSSFSLAESGILAYGGLKTLQSLSPTGVGAAKSTPRLFHYTDSAGAAGVRASGRTLIPGEASGGKVWATSITPEQMYGPAGWFHRLRIGGGVNFEFGDPLGIRYSGTTKFTRYFEIVDPVEFSRAWIPEPYKGFMGQFVKEGAAAIK